MVFFGNEFFDALPIKQFKRKKNSILEKSYTIDKNYKITEIFNRASKTDIKILKSYKTLKKLNFIELPKLSSKLFFLCFITDCKVFRLFDFKYP